ncbi:phosphoenolpyruvate/phosphate translocator 1, chloroplastic [Elysia marginata]|uniref:Phosphoenolpyruvate/phosphate translocator 1, chloroplastic n=1 Tax=Elysia marginata TaxID=1093978 RepID=A0AAV4ISJ4_9GAST|nr:phosphoenolpyruvate/phosphate translocator 1, chloroplastic [Elysia marginata]
MEPITSAVIQFLLMGTPLSPMAILSLPVIVCGAIIFSGNPLTQSNLPFGIAAAFMSNIILAFRNVALKERVLKAEKTGILLKPLQCSMLAPAILCITVLGVAWTQELVADRMLYLATTCSLSGFFHVLYSYVSTGIVLLHLSVVSHAVTNILKRVLVVLLLYVSGSRSASPINFLGLGVCTLGLVVYASTKRDKETVSATTQRDTHEPVQRLDLKARLKYLLLITCLLFGGLCVGILRYPVVSIRSDSVFPERPAQTGLGFTHPNGFNTATWLTPPVMTAPSLNLRGAVPPTERENTQFERTFTSRAHELPERKELLPDLEGYLSEHKRDIQVFLQEDLLSKPNRSSFLSRQLRSRVEVIKETQRLHFEIIGKTLKKYKYAMLFDLAAFENKGDPCISVGEIYFLARIKLDLVYYCSAQTCVKENIRMAAKLARNYSPQELVVLVHGGGNIVGYKFSDYQRFTIFREFAGYKILVFPQSVFIPDFHSQHFDLCKKEYCCNENVTIVMRDHQSYSYAKQYFSGASKFILAPDMAFQIGPMPRFLSPVFDIMWIKRTDTESPGYTEVPAPPPGVRMHVSDWWKWATPKAPSSLETAYYMCTNGFFYLQRGRVIITDRLHGHILATLLDIPHVLIDNKQHKLSSYHSSWTQGLENTYITHDPVIALDMALKLLGKYKDSLPPRVPFLNIDERTGRNDIFDRLDFTYT